MDTQVNIQQCFMISVCYFSFMFGLFLWWDRRKLFRYVLQRCFHLSTVKIKFYMKSLWIESIQEQVKIWLSQSLLEVSDFCYKICLKWSFMKLTNFSATCCFKQFSYPESCWWNPVLYLLPLLHTVYAAESY